jgi:acyl-lipid omega-6 desaturase (Delta-12 desaturase)
MIVQDAESVPAEIARAAAPWAATVARYKRSNELKSSWQIANTFVPFFALWYLMYLSLALPYWVTLLLAIPAAGLRMRIFIIQHDCGHHSFLKSKLANDVLGTICGAITLTPYRLWKRTHSRHHASSGNLDHRGHGDVVTLTVAEYQSRSPWGRLRYRLYRHPLVLFFFGASFLFIIRQRLTLGIPRTWKSERRSVHLTNLGILAVWGLGSWTLGLWNFFLVEAPTVVLGAALGTWLFYIQHQYEGAYWQPHRSWDFTRSALAGSSYYRLPRVLQWFSGNIGFHHIHHLNIRIPNYHLPACYAAEPAFREGVTFGLRESLRCASWKLWDERAQRMVTFAEVE